MLRRQTRQRSMDDADVAAGRTPTPPPSSGLGQSDLEFFEDLVSEPVLVLGVDISHLTRQMQFCVCASGTFGFSLLYGYLQELLSVHLLNRQLGLFLAMMQFAGYTILAFLLRSFVYQKAPPKSQPVPLAMYVGLSLLRAVDLGMTNLAMQYVSATHPSLLWLHSHTQRQINYPAKTLMKSSRVVFTMLFGVLIARKKYKLVDYAIVLCMVAGLALFMHADAHSSAVFAPTGVIMLTISLLCDGAISNVSEHIMVHYGVGQDEFIFRLYSISLLAISAAAAAKGDLREGLAWMVQTGSYGSTDDSYSIPAKWLILTLFSSMGFFGSSCSAAITKNFGALSMSITSTARKATTLFLSFFLFNNVCTSEHVAGISVFLTALLTKSLRRSGAGGGNKKRMKRKESELPSFGSPRSNDGLKRRSASADGSPRAEFGGIHIV